MSDDLLSEFIFDSREHLATAGAQLMDLEKDQGSISALNALMGTFHTIKGNSGFLGLSNLYQLLHHAESLLQTVREKKACCTNKFIDLVLQVLDTVEAIFDRLENGEDDNADWLSALNQALSESEAELEGQNSAAASPAESQSHEFIPDETLDIGANKPEPAKIVIRDDLSGKVKLLALKDGQLTEEENILAAKAEAMFEAGLRGLVIDLQALAAISSRELKALMAVGRINPAQTAYLLDTQKQESLHRVFLILQLDRFMHFFPDREKALAFIEGR